MLWKFITLLTFLMGCVLDNTAAAAPAHNFQVDFNQLLLNSVNYAQNSPGRYKDCFTYYQPLLKKVGDDYEDEVFTCGENAEESRFWLNSDGYVVDARAELANLSSSLCATLKACNENENATKFFQCHANYGSDASRASNGISYKANEFVGYVKDRYKVIDTQENVCVNAASATYTRDWSILSEKLEKCFQSDEPLFTTTPSTTEQTEVTTEGAPITDA